MSNIENFIQIKNNLLNKDNELTKLDKKLNETFQLELDKYTFIDRIENNINEIYNLGSLLQFKYNDLKFYYDFFNIVIIIISAILTILEALKNEIDYENERDSIKYFFKLGPIFFSTLIILIGTILKFKKYQINLEDLTKTLEKAILTAFRMKKLQEQLHFANEIKLDTIKEMYLDEIFILFNQSVAEMTKCISFSEKIDYKQKFKRYKEKEIKCIPIQDTNKENCRFDIFKDRFLEKNQEIRNDDSSSNFFFTKNKSTNESSKLQKLKRISTTSSEKIVNLQLRYNDVETESADSQKIDKEKENEKEIDTEQEEFFKLMGRYPLNQELNNLTNSTQL